MTDQPGGPANGAHMPASVLEPLQARSDSSCTNPFGQYDTHDTSQQTSEAGEARTAFAAASGLTSDGGHMENAASVLYPEGLPKFLGLFHPAMTFGIGYSTLSRGMDFIAHFVAVTTMVCLFGVLTAVSWMQKLCLPIVSHWDHNYSLGFGAFMVVLAIFSWRSATNFDLKRSKVFLFLLGWRLHSFLLLSLLMLLGLALKPQLHAHIEDSVRACVLGSNGSGISPGPPPVSVGFVPQTSANPDTPLTPALSDANPGSMETSAAASQAPEDAPSATAGKVPKAEARGMPTPAQESGETPATTAAPPLVPQTSLVQQSETLPVQQSEPPASAVQPGDTGTGDSGKQPGDNSPVGSSDIPAATAGEGIGVAAVENGAATAPAGPQETPTAVTLLQNADSVAAITAAQATSSSEVPFHGSTGSTPSNTETHVDKQAAAVPQESQQTPQPPAPKVEFDGQKLALEAEQRSAVRESNAVIVVILVLASAALLFELYLVYACWSFKVWMERGYESVVLAGAPPFSTMDTGSGWLAYAVRMPQTVQMETYGNDARGPSRLPLFVQTTDTSDCASHLGLPMTGLW